MAGGSVLITVLLCNLVKDMVPSEIGELLGEKDRC
jgi:hypothetical protein